AQESLNVLKLKFEDKLQESRKRRLTSKALAPKHNKAVTKVLHVKILEKVLGTLKLVRKSFCTDIGKVGYIPIHVKTTSNAEQWMVLTSEAFKPNVHFVPYLLNAVGEFEKLPKPSLYTYQMLADKHARARTPSTKWNVYMYAPGTGRAELSKRFLAKRRSTDDKEEESTDQSDESIFTDDGNSPTIDKSLAQNVEVMDNINQLDAVNNDIGIEESDMSMAQIVEEEEAAYAVNELVEINLEDEDEHQIDEILNVLEAGTEVPPTSSAAAIQDILEKKLEERKQTAEERMKALVFPSVNERRITLSVEYNNNVIERPFRHLDVVKDVFDWTIADMPVTLPAQFALVCLSCDTHPCTHKYVLNPADRDLLFVSEMTRTLAVKE
uniref:Uncharacterized protein LOC100369230 n=1 Tax=Saccoglossus kowalevskii TaxID=10224 RepID=A0ABM0GSS7_SACKO